jgi:protein SCO1/2
MTPTACALPTGGVSGPGLPAAEAADDGVKAMPVKIVQFSPRCEGDRPRRGPRGFLALAAAALVAVAACSPRGAAPAQSADAQIGGPFTLVDQNGRSVDQSMLKGKWSIVFFGYTFCPDFCPLTLTTLGRTMTELGPKASAVQVVFITVDPARDTPAELKTYLSSKVFPRNAIGLSGTPAQIAQVAKEYGVYYQKDGSGPNYTVDHSTGLYLLDPSGRFKGVLADGQTPKEQASEIEKDMQGT